MRHSVLFLVLAAATACLGADAVTELKAWLAKPAASRAPLGDQAFAGAPLTKTQADAAQALLWADHVATFRRDRAAEVTARALREGDLVMPFFYSLHGKKPAGGRSLFVSMHGGGGAPKAVNDQQYENQKALYAPEEGVYLAPRAPTDTWNLWHEAHIDRLFDRLIQNLIVLEDVNPNRVYLMGYSAGGDGVYQLAPRMADRFAAAAMMAGHPNDASPLGLRNLPFIIQVGALDDGYNRNKVAAEWGKKLDDLQKADPAGYVHETILREGKHHGMDRDDAMAVPWMAKATRSPFPTRVVWHQSGTTHRRFYWLAVDGEHAKAGADVVASYDKAANTVTIESSSVDRLTVRLSDAMVNLNRPVTVRFGEKVLQTAYAPRSIVVIAQTMDEYGDPASVCAASIDLTLPGR
ncbi:MAG: alpha/beta hydrolase [Armatimonadetes bacterium]|nr:alpha/beta hydrolase [Armatimonadota bacterium]